MLNKNNLNIARICSSDSSKYAINGVLVEQDLTVATDGHRMLLVATPCFSPDDFPVISGQGSALAEFAPFVIPKAVALNIAKAIPAKERLPALMNAAVVAVTPEKVSIAVTDLDTEQIFQVRTMTGKFANWRMVLPNPVKAETAVAFTVEVLAGVLAEMKSLGVKHVVWRGYGADSASRIDGVIDGSQNVTAVVMPCRMPTEAPPTWGIEFPVEFNPELEPPVVSSAESQPSEMAEVA